MSFSNIPNSVRPSVRRPSTSKPRHNLEKCPTPTESLEPQADDDPRGVRQNAFMAQRGMSPATGSRYTRRPSLPSSTSASSFLPDVTCISFRLPYIRHLQVTLDCRNVGEDILLIGALIFATWKNFELPTRDSQTWTFIGKTPDFDVVDLSLFGPRNSRTSYSFHDSFLPGFSPTDKLIRRFTPPSTIFASIESCFPAKY